jgi:hypothetical protein
MRSFRVMIFAIVFSFALSRFGPRDFAWAPLLAVLYRGVVGIHWYGTFFLVTAAATISVWRSRSNLHAEVHGEGIRCALIALNNTEHNRTTSADMRHKMLQVPVALSVEMKCLLYLPF